VAVSQAVAMVCRTDAVITASPTFRARYNGLLNPFLKRFGAGSLPNYCSSRCWYRSVATVRWQASTRLTPTSRARRTSMSGSMGPVGSSAWRDDPGPNAIRSDRSRRPTSTDRFE
jgi:hypothetical protein